ncbi:MAG: carboxypeptidase regulatory-like domain-containing protein [Bacteroidales bacterium]|nr:carboxypeptidase regulatory-like domain-containing protein [Bacteroidales bacterium]
MNILQKVKLTMYMVVKDFLRLNATIVENLPNYKTNATVLDGNILKIQGAAELQAFKKTGIADEKNQLRASLIAQAEDFSLKLVAYAANVGNMILLKEVKYTKSEMIRAADADLKNMAQCIYNRAHENIDALAAYGIAERMVTMFLNTINSFNEAIPTVREGAMSKKLYTTQLEDLYKEMDAALSNIDRIVEIVRLSHPDFYRGYQNSRLVIKRSGGSVALKGVVTDASSHEPLRGVTLIIAPVDGNGAAIVKKTADKGGFMVKSLSEGVYNVTVSKSGYKDQVVTVAITNGELSVLNVEMNKN